VILSVYLSVDRAIKTKTAETKITKLGTGIVQHDTLPSNGQRSKVKVRVRRSNGRRELSSSGTSIECSSVIIIIIVVVVVIIIIFFTTTILQFK